MSVSTHYENGACQDASHLAEWSKKVAKLVMKKFPAKQKVRPMLIYTGMSGTSSAIALALAIRARSSRYKFGMMYVRKEGEKSHGNKVEVNALDGEYELVFCDDFKSSGRTLTNCLNAARGYSHMDISVTVPSSPEDVICALNKEMGLN